MYTEKVMDHFMHPRNVGEIDNASGVGTVGNAKCGDIMRIFLDIDENQILAWTLFIIARSGLCEDRVAPVVRKASLGWQAPRG